MNSLQASRLSFHLRYSLIELRINPGKVMTDTTEQQIETVLEKVRPFLQREGGDVEYIGFKDGIVYVRMVGACEGCAYVDQDISAGVEIILMEEVPGVIKCDATGVFPQDVMNQYLARKEQENLAAEKNPTTK
jgi:Fe-S cluster biogenesis protein NfuA